MPTKKQTTVYSFAEIVPLLTAGKHLTDRKWPEGWECYLENNLLKIKKPENTVHDWIISLNDLMSEEYEVIDA